MSCLNIEQTQPQLSHQICAISKQMKQELSKSNYNNSKPFFVSSTHHYLQKLIHLHSLEINQILGAQSKQLEVRLLKDKSMERDQQLTAEWMKENGGRQCLGEIQRLLGQLIMRECLNKSVLQIKNVFLQISCLMTYSCGICLKSNENKPHSIKLIKHFSHQLYLEEPQTMKSISLQQPQKNKLQSILQSMKAQRNTIKQKQQAKQRKLNKIWNMLGTMMELDRQQFTIDYILSQDNKENNILRELRLKNHKNQLQIIKFKNKAKIYFKRNKQDKIPLQSASIEHQRQNKSSNSSNYRSNQRKTALIYPKRNSLTRIKINSQKSSKKSQQSKGGTKICFLNLENETTPFAKNRISACKDVRYNHFYRSFKSSKDVQILKQLQPVVCPTNISLKLI